MGFNKQPGSISLEIQWDKSLPDILILVLYTFFLDQMTGWQYSHPALSCSILIILNIAAVGFGCYTFFSMYSDESGLISYKNSLTKFESAAIGLSAFISIFGFLWWLVPFAAAKKLGVKDTGFIFGTMAYFIVFISAVAISIGNNKKDKTINKTLLNITNIISATFFFFFSYSFLVMSLQYWQPAFAEKKVAGIICLIVFYLPLRFFLLLRPPRSRLEYFTFLLSFVYMLYTLFVKV